MESKCYLLSQKSNKIEVVLLGGHSHCNGEKGQKHLAFLKPEKNIFKVTHFQTPKSFLTIHIVPIIYEFQGCI